MARDLGSLVKELREQTGAGMMDCKRALAGDERRPRGGDRRSCARRAWRRPPSAPAARRPRARSATASPTTARGHDGRRRLRDRAGLEQRGVPRLRAAGARRGRRSTASAPSRELEERARRARRRSSARTSSSPARPASRPSTARRLAAYVHPPANKLGVLVQLRGGDADLGRQARDAHRRRRARSGSAARTCPRTTVAAEREIFANSDEVQSKPEQAREKIVEGMLEQAVLRRERPRRPGVDPRRRQDASAQALAGGRRRGARVPALLALAER